MAHYQAYYMHVCMHTRVFRPSDQYIYFKTWYIEKGALVCYLI